MSRRRAGRSFRHCANGHAGLLLTLCFAPAIRADIQILHAFPDPTVLPMDGAETDGSLFLFGSSFYGTTEDGGANGGGSIFRYDLNTGTYNVIHDFSNAATAGQTPVSTLIAVGNTFYGTTDNGGALGANDGGTIFKIDASGSNFGDIHSFGSTIDPTNGWKSFKGVTASGRWLFGSSFGGGDAGNGAVYRFDTLTNAFTLLHSFTAGDTGINNPDGGQPEAGIVVSGSTLYGATNVGGTGGRGTLFSMDTSGNQFSLIHSFTGTAVNGDGDSPTGTPILAGNTLFGTTFNGGVNAGISGQGDGTLYRVGTSGNNYQVLHSFAAATDGRFPYGEVLLAGSTLYGMTSDGGPGHAGTFFLINADGSGFRVLHAFTGSDDGGSPIAAVVRIGDAFYGLTESGGANFRGVLFKFQLPPLIWTGQADNTSWNFAAGNWNDGSGPAAYADPFSVIFDDSAPFSAGTVTLSGAVTPTSVAFNGSTHAFTLAGAGSLIDVGSMTKNAPAAATLALPVRISGALTINAGTLALTSASAIKTASLSIAHSGAGSSAAYTAALNLADGKLIVQSSDSSDKTAKIADLNIAISSGANAATWTGNGITSSSAATDVNHYGVGLFDNAVLQKTSFGGQPIDTNSILIAIAHLGDANRNGVVDIQDVSIVANNWQKSRNNWAQGDLNRDGIVNIQDFSIVANNWQQTSAYTLEVGSASAQSQFVPDSTIPMSLSIPEPTSLSVGVMGLWLLARRRKSRQGYIFPSHPFPSASTVIS